MNIVTALTRVALACGAALVMATAALGALHTSSDREPAGLVASPPRPAVRTEPEMPAASELELGSLPGGPSVTW